MGFAVTGMVAGKVVVVTGAGGGIGRDIALALARPGRGWWSTTSASRRRRRPQRGRPQRWWTRSAPPAARRWPTPTASPSRRRRSASSMRARQLRAHRRRRQQRRHPARPHVPQDERRRMGRCDPRPPLRQLLRQPCRRRHFKEQESGAFVHMTSTSGLIGNFGQANYSAAKLGIVGAVEDRSRSTCRASTCAPTASRRSPGAA